MFWINDMIEHSELKIVCRKETIVTVTNSVYWICIIRHRVLLSEYVKFYEVA